jgi:hypothetical protein
MAVKKTRKRAARAKGPRVAKRAAADRGLIDTIQESVDQGAKTAEEIHRAIADLPLEIMERAEVFGKTARQIREMQDKAIGAVYDLVRDVNKRVGNYSSDLVERLSA